MQYQVQVNDNSILALSNNSYLSNTATQNDGDTDFVGISNMTLNILCPNIVQSSDDNITLLSAPITENLYYSDNGNYILYTGETEQVSTSIVPVLTGPDENVTDVSVTDSWKIFNDTDSTNILSASHVIYDFGVQTEITRLAIKADGGSFQIEGSNDGTNYAVISVLSNAEELQAILDGTILNIESPGLFQYYKILSTGNALVTSVKYFKSFGDKLLMGNISSVFNIDIVTTINSNIIDIKSIVLENTGSSKSDVVVLYEDVPIVGRMFTTRFNMKKDFEFVGYTASVYKVLL